MKPLADYARHRESLEVTEDPPMWAGHYSPDLLGELKTSSGPTAQAIFWLLLPFGFSDVQDSYVVFETFPLAWIAWMSFDGGVRFSTWVTTLEILDDGTLSYAEPVKNVLRIPKLDNVFDVLSQHRLKGRLVSFEESVLAAVRQT